MSAKLLSHLECSGCGRIYDHHIAQTYCQDNSCHQPLIVKYDLTKSIDKTILENRPFNMWRYKELLPIENDENIVTLGEGMTKMIHTKSLGDLVGMDQLYVKDESNNPTGSFKSRGLSMAVSKAKELGLNKLVVPTAGNAGSALSAYCAAGGIEAKVYMPIETPDVFKMDCQITGASIHMVDGNISDCAKQMVSDDPEHNWFDVSTMKEPYRLEGKKTMGYEIAEQLNWKLPDVIVYPTGGGTGLIGIWKAFKELYRLGWIGKVKTKMVAIQVEGCSPIASAFRKKWRKAKTWLNPILTIANGLRVPTAFADRLILKSLYQSKGNVVTVTDAEIVESLREMAMYEGLFVSPEGAAVWAGLKKLRKSNWIKSFEKVVMLNTGSAYKYVENLRDLSFSK